MRGYTKKGKLFLGFDTNMTEAISSMSITGNELCVAGTHVYNHYTDCKDANCFLSEDVITDVLALPGEKVRERGTNGMRNPVGIRLGQGLGCVIPRLGCRANAHELPFECFESTYL